MLIQENKAKMYPDIHKAMIENTLLSEHWYIVRAMGAYGESTFGGISSAVWDDYALTNESVMSELINRGYVSWEVIHGGTIQFLVYNLTEKGEDLYRYWFDMKLVESEAHRLARENDNVSHGYFIVETVSILRDWCHYTDLTMDRSANTYQAGTSKWGNQKQWIPDIVGKDQSGKTVYIEVEHAKHIQASFDDKLNKACLHTDELYFVAKDMEGVAKLKSQIDAWASKYENQNLTLWVQSLRTVKSMGGFGNPYTPRMENAKM